MKYYSETLDKIFDTQEELFAAEKENKHEQDKAADKIKEALAERTTLVATLNELKLNRQKILKSYAKVNEDISKAMYKLNEFDRTHQELRRESKYDSMFDMLFSEFSDIL